MLLLSYILTCNWGERERAPSCGLNGRAVTIDIPYSGYFSRGNIFVVFVVERRTTKYLHTKKTRTACARPKWVWF